MKRNKIFPVLLAAILLLTLAACSGSKSDGNSSPASSPPASPGSASPSASAAASDGEDAKQWDPFSKYDETVNITIGRQGVSGNNLPKGDTLENNQYLKYVEDKLNVKIKYDFAVEDGEAYKQKVNLVISSKQIPDVMIVDENQFLRLAEADMLADLTEAYEKSASPLIKEYYESFKGRVLDSVKIDGKLLALPDTNLAGTHQLLWVRKDWLDKLKLQPPSTVDELMAVSKAFAAQDPDGNSKPDTVGLLGDPTLAADGAFFTFDPIFTSFGSFPGNWIKDASGAVTYGSITSETKAALGKLREMYEGGMIDKEFVTRKWNDNAAMVAGGKAGILFAPWYAGWMLSDSVKNDPKAEWIPLTAPLDANGKRNMAVSRPAGQYLVVSKDFEHPEAVVKVLSTQYEGLRLKDPAAEELYKGLGVSWLNWPLNLQLNYEDAVSRDAQALKQAFEAKDPSSLAPDQKTKYDSMVKDAEAPKKDIPSYANVLAFYIGGLEVGSDKLNRVVPVFYGQTETMIKKGANLSKLENETFLKIVTGQAGLDSFDKFVTQWKALGGDEVTQEVTAQAK